MRCTVIADAQFTSKLAHAPALDVQPARLIAVQDQTRAPQMLRSAWRRSFSRWPRLRALGSNEFTAGCDGLGCSAPGYVIGYNDEPKMAHPSGGSGGTFNTHQTFANAYSYVGKHGIRFRSTTGQRITATQGEVRSGNTPTIVFTGDDGIRHGSVCSACWGFRIDCNQSRIGHCAEPLDENVH
jgi:hypothetical protein